MIVYYRILGLGENAGDEQIRQAYLDRVKKFPPGKHPEEFKQITRAYEALKNRRARVKSKLMGTYTNPDWTQALDDFLETLNPGRALSPGLKQLAKAQETDHEAH